MPLESQTEIEAVAGVPRQLLIGPRWTDAGDGRTFPVDDPSTGAVLCEVADAGPADARAAADAAVAAQDSWAATPPRVRADILLRTYHLVLERLDQLALVMTLEMGKPLAESRAEITYAADFLRWFAEEAVRIDGGYAVAPAGGSRLLLTRQPVGPCLLITPWNFPMAMGARKIGPAIAAGCTMVVKPAQKTPLSMLALAGILREAGLPDGVLNLVTTARTSATMDPLLDDLRIRKISFTGSTGVGQALMRRVANGVMRTSMELGGNAPFVVFADADLDLAVEGAVIAKMRNGGEACTAANRFLVQRPVLAEFSAALAKRLGDLRVGRGVEDGVEVGPLIDVAARDGVAALVEDAVGRGATVLTGGGRVDGPGAFYRPTVLTDLAPDARVLREEIFGPVAPVTAFDTDDEAIHAANDTEYGLVGYVYTQNLDRALRVAERLETGMVGLNQPVVSNPAAPFGGVKASGLGREGGSVGIDEYLSLKYVAVRAWS